MMTPLHAIAGRGGRLGTLFGEMPGSHHLQPADLRAFFRVQDNGSYLQRGVEFLARDSKPASIPCALISYRIQAALGEGFRVYFGSNRIGTDDFVWQDLGPI